MIAGKILMQGRACQKPIERKKKKLLSYLFHSSLTMDCQDGLMEG